MSARRCRKLSPRPPASQAGFEKKIFSTRIFCGDKTLALVYIVLTHRERSRPPASAASKPRIFKTHLRRAVRSLHGTKRGRPNGAGSRRTARLTTSRRTRQAAALQAKE